MRVYYQAEQHDPEAPDGYVAECVWIEAPCPKKYIRVWPGSGVIDYGWRLSKWANLIHEAPHE